MEKYTANTLEIFLGPLTVFKVVLAHFSAGLNKVEIMLFPSKHRVLDTLPKENPPVIYFKVGTQKERKLCRSSNL